MNNLDKSWWFYVVETVDDYLYAGVTTDVERRYKQHLSGGPKAAKFLRAHKPKSLRWEVWIGTKSEALQAEHAFKSKSRAQKLKLINEDLVKFDVSDKSWSVLPMQIRDAEKSDLPDIVQLLANDSLGVTREAKLKPSQVNRRSPYVKAFETIQTDPNHRIFVVQAEGGAILGCFQWSLIPGLTYEGRPRVQIEGVRVAEGARGTGLGTLMMAYAMKLARKHRCALIQLTTDRRRKQAEAFYGRCGFKATHHGMKRWFG